MSSKCLFCDGDLPAKNGVEENDFQTICEECENCEHDEYDHGICLDCGEDISDELCNRAHEHSEGMER